VGSSFIVASIQGESKTRNEGNSSATVGETRAAERSRRAINKREKVAKMRDERAAQRRLEREEKKRQEEMDRERELQRLEHEQLHRSNFTLLYIHSFFHSFILLPTVLTVALMLPCCVRPSVVVVVVCDVMYCG